MEPGAPGSLVGTLSPTPKAPMSLLRSPRFTAALLLAAAALGLILANSPAAPAFEAVSTSPTGIPGLDVTHAIGEGLLALFFFSVAAELRHELTAGMLSTARAAALPALAAAGGVVVPIVIYLALTAGLGTPAGAAAAPGWPVPTATDIAFALGVLAVFGAGLPARVRVFLLALAILDDLAGIVMIAVLFTDDINPWMLLAAAAALLALRLVATFTRRGGAAVRTAGTVVVVALAVAVWWFVWQSGVHATLAGVAIGMVLPSAQAERARTQLDPWINTIVLPLFAVSAAAVAIPAVSPSDISPALWAIMIALPVGKIVGIAGAGWLAQRALRHSSSLPLADLLAVGALGGVGFTVSMLLADLSFAGNAALQDEATLGVLAGSVISLLVGAALVSWRARAYRTGRIVAA